MIEQLKELTYDEVREIYKLFLSKHDFSVKTIQTAYSDTFYLWRTGSKELFWKVVTDDDFEETAKTALFKALTENSKGNAESLVSSYLSHFRRFHHFAIAEVMPVIPDKQKNENNKTVKPLYVAKKKLLKEVPLPSVAQVEYYLKKWDNLENYHLQENALNKLFFELCPNNTDISDVLLKAATLNDFYSTNIFSIYPVAKHICELHIDENLKRGDVSLVENIQYVVINGVKKNFYSFATKYCSHHNPTDFPIYDSYVDEILRHFRKRDQFSRFQDAELKNYASFKNILLDFQRYYGLDQYNLKEIDQYVWQLGKEYFPKNYGKKI